MAVVTYTDADGVEHWADEHSKAYEKHVKSQEAPVEEVPVDEPAARPVVETPARVQAPRTDPKAAADAKVAEPKKD
ncbi:hypothetical protein [Rhodococcus sp. B10]|uniref:hypothetical protein n=1 Tax=Rhodococcus sp. B10 TaxID=2695876 RepID=UPI00142F724D|nr:hypothetical protein [Rhodococcus sp. B10]NIL77606.1 hypothetical protein [Rhodococcus sp. B10]